MPARPALTHSQTDTLNRQLGRFLAALAVTNIHAANVERIALGPKTKATLRRAEAERDQYRAARARAQEIEGEIRGEYERITGDSQKGPKHGG